MKTSVCRFSSVLVMLAAPFLGSAQAQTADEPTEESRTIPLLTAEQLDELLGPIALYPDALIALILPAATMPTDLVLASRYLGAGGDAAKVDSQPWDESVRALGHYPDVVKWMDDKLSWSIMMGDAFIAQPVDVMQSIQRLRTRARAAGTLVDSKEQQVVEEEGSIRIVPARPEVIYVPVYDPQVVYYPQPWGWYRPAISFSWCYPSGIWLSYGCDWSNSRVWVVNSSWRHDWYYGGAWCGPSYRHYPHYYHDDHGRGWAPHSGGHHPDYRQPGRGRPTHVVVDNGGQGGHPRVVSQPRQGGHSDGNNGRDSGSPRGGRDASDGQRGPRSEGPRVVTTPSSPDHSSGAPSPRTPRSDVSTPRADPGPALANDGTSRRWIGRATNPGQPASTVRTETPALAPRVAAPQPRSNPPVSVPRDPAPRTVTPSPDNGNSRRWVGRATNPGNPPAVRETVTTPERTRERPAPAVSSPRYSAPPVHSAPSSGRTQVVQSPRPSAPSTPVVIAPSSSGNSSQPAPQTSSPRSGRDGGGSRQGGGEQRADRRSNDG